MGCCHGRAIKLGRKPSPEALATVKAILSKDLSRLRLLLDDKEAEFMAEVMGYEKELKVSHLTLELTCWGPLLLALYANSLPIAKYLIEDK